MRLVSAPLQVFIADGERQMRRLRGENVMVLRTDRRALYIYTESQWINVLVTRKKKIHPEGSIKKTTKICVYVQ